jgi:SAM-dependent methyltransferase
MPRRPGTSPGAGRDPYAEPALYDALHARGTAAEARALVRLAAAFAPRARGVWLEPACGTGRLLVALAGMGERAVGVEIDPGMAAFAAARLRRRELSRRARVVVGDMRDVSVAVGTGRVRAAFCLDNSVRHLRSDAAMVEHLRSVRAALAPGGVYLVGVSLLPEGGGFPSEHVAEGRLGRTAVRQVVEFTPPEPGSRVEWALSAVSVGERVLTARYPLRTYTPGQWAGVVRRSGLREVAVVGMDGRGLGAGRTAYAVRVLAA